MLNVSNIFGIDDRKMLDRKKRIVEIDLKRFDMIAHLMILTKDIIAANSKILTSRSSNCSKTNCQMDFPGRRKKDYLDYILEIN